VVSSVIALKKQIEAIEGFLELGMLREAGEEFEKIDPQHRTLVDVMVVQMAIYRRMLMWEQVAIIARAIARSFPDDAKWHLQWAEALNECDEHRQARDVLAAVQERFADNAELQFTLDSHHNVSSCRGRINGTSSALQASVGSPSSLLTAGPVERSAYRQALKATRRYGATAVPSMKTSICCPT